MKIANIFKKKRKSIGKACLSAILVMVVLINITSYAVSVNYYRTLGSSEALNSPILNSQFSEENWNKWEMLTWGVYLSNFAQPFVDTYESAFSSSSGNGSQGAGYAALVFGGASDSGSEETLQNLLNYAITQQTGDFEKVIYVTFNTLNEDGSITRNDPPTRAGATETTDSSGDTSDDTSGDASGDASGDGTEDIGDIVSSSDATIRPARITDLFVEESGDEDTTWATFGADARGVINDYDWTINDWESTNYGKQIVYCGDGNLPTFWVQTSNSTYEKVFDYTDSWDLQMFSASLIKALSGDYSDETMKQIQGGFDDEYNLVLDSFGNICAKTPEGRKVIVQAASNQHLTADSSINLLTSTVFNGYMQDITENQLTNLSMQAENGGWFGTDFLGTSQIASGGLPAFAASASSISSGTVLLYFDLDTIAIQNKLFGGDAMSGDTLSYGRAVKELMDCNFDSTLGSEYTLKIETLNSTDIASKLEAGETSSGLVKYTTAMNTINVASMLANQVESNFSKAKVLDSITDLDGTEISILSDPVLVPVQTNIGGGSNGKANSNTARRLMMKHLYKVYKSGVSNSYGSVGASDLDTALSKNTPSEFINSLIGLDTSNQKASRFTCSFVSSYSGSLYDITCTSSQLDNMTISGVATDFLYTGVVNGKESVKFTAAASFIDDGHGEAFPGRLVLVYPVSEVMRIANNYLGLKDGAEYSAYASKIYMTYLQWYGVTGTGEDATSGFNTRIFDGTSDVLNVEIDDLVNAISQEEMEQEILNMTYLMLHPDEGREYRNTLVRNNLSDFLYSQYQSTVYGQSVSYSSGNLTTTKSAGGFLNIETLADNFTTGWFIEKYIDIVALILVIILVLIIIFGILKGRQLSWYFVSMIVAVNAVLLTPATGDIVPYIANKVVQSIFTDNMTFWSLSESVENAELESEYNSTSSNEGYLAGLTQDERGQVLSLVRSLSSINLDRSLTIKRDISSKVNQEMSGSYAEIQELQSARWLLPMIMRQYTANDLSTDYVSIPLGDMYDDLSNLYWLYKPLDAEASDTLTSNQAGTQLSDSVLQLLETKATYPGYIDTSVYDGEVNYKNESYSIASSVNEIEHNYMYIIANSSLSMPSLKSYVDSQGGYKSLDSLSGYAEYCINQNPAIVSTMKDFVSTIEEQASTYDRTDRGTMKQVYGYLWTTESPYHYLYGVVKDSFAMTDTMNNELTMASIIGMIQGSYVVDDDGNEVRSNFMYADETGDIKDVLDLENMFTNLIPYMYQMQLLAGGDDGTGGTLEGVTISDEYSIYEGSDAAWLFRSNWVTKLVENPDYSDAETVRGADGTAYTVANPVLPFTYPTERPMVFSEAQMNAAGLKESDLSLMELKCVEINRQVARRWTMLLNYANVDGMTKEVLLRQMATEAVLEFNSQMSPTSILSGTYAMYPNSVDLRALSFDSIMRMLLLNVTRNTGYLVSDTMLNVISNLDLLSAILLWIAAELCSWFIPLARQILMGAIFYLGLLSTLYSLVSTNLDKAKRSCGQVVINLAFLAVTILYYLFFKLLMGMTTTDSVLTVSSVQVNVGNPVWCFVLIIAVSIIYVIIMVKMFKFCFLNFRDMGFEVISSMASAASERVSNFVNGAVTSVQNFFGGGSGSTGTGRSVKGSGKDTGRQSRVAGDAEVVVEQGNTPNNSNDDGVRPEVDEQRAGTSYDDIPEPDNSEDFDEEIERGQSMN